MMTKQKTDKRIAALERKIKQLEAAQTPPPASTVSSEESVEAYRDRVHQMRERAANNFQFSPQVLGPMVKACGTDDLRDLVHASHRPQGPSAGGIPSSQTLGGIHPGGGASISPGSGTGWVKQREWGADGQHPVPGVAAADRLMDEADRRDRAAKIAEDKARRDALK
jgi:hypothetical protein